MTIRAKGGIKPKLWWRYRDYVFTLWTQGESKLLEFTNYINSLCPTIKFKLVYSGESFNVLDLTLHLQNGHIVTNIYSKSTDSHLYLPFTSSHPYHCKKVIPYGVASRAKRNYSTAEFTEKACSRYKVYLKQQNYDIKFVDKQFEKAMQRGRSDILKLENKFKKETIPLVLEYNPRLPNVSKIIKRHRHLIDSLAGLQEIFPAGSIIPAYRRTKNLKDLLAPSRFKVNVININNNVVLDVVGYIKCKRKCDLCTSYLVESDRFTSLAMGRFYEIKQTLYCTSTDVVYLVSCGKCML